MGKDDLLTALLAENRRLRELLVRQGIPADAPEVVAETPEPLPPSLSETEKIRIFRSLFRGREDVHPSAGSGRMDAKDTCLDRTGIGGHTTPLRKRTKNALIGRQESTLCWTTRPCEPIFRES